MANQGILRTLARILQLLDIGKILQTPGRFLIRNQVVTRNHECAHTGKTSLETIGPGICKINAINLSDDVDAQRWHADLEDRSALAQVLNREIANGFTDIR